MCMADLHQERDVRIVEAVVDKLPSAPRLDQALGTEHAKMLRDGGLADVDHSS